MPELPDLEILREYLSSRLVGVAVKDLQVLAPIVVRSADPQGYSRLLKGKRFENVSRRGKFLIFHLESGLFIVVNPMLSGRFHYAKASEFDERRRFFLSITLEDGQELRYSDDTSMGRIYLLESEKALASVPKLAKLGVEALDPGLTLQKFSALLKHFNWEIKKVLTYQPLIAGIGNAYVDEILFSAKISPFKLSSALSTEEKAKLYSSMRDVLAEAIYVLRARVGDEIDVEIRDFLKIHGKGGQACPVCGTRISEVRGENKGKTNFCRTCQPGTLFR